MKLAGGNFAVLTSAVRFSKDLTDRQKLVYAEVTALSNKEGYCYATNKYIGDLYGRSPETISRDISALEKYKFISIEYYAKPDGGTIRHIYPIMDKHNRLDEMVKSGHDDMIKPRLDETVKQNNINKNNISIEREREQFTEVMRYYRAKVNNRWEVSTNGKYRKRLSDLIHQGRAISDIKKVIDHRFAELENGLPQYLVEPDNIFKHDLFLKTLNAANFKPAQKPKPVNGKNSGIQLAGEEDFKDKPSGWENYGI